MKELAALLEDLKEQRIRLEIERGDAPTSQKIFAFVEDLIKGGTGDKAFQKRVIANLVNSVYVYDDRTVIYFSFESGEKPFISKDETEQAINEKAPEHESSGTVPLGGGNRI